MRLPLMLICAYLPVSMWDLPGSGIEPLFPAQGDELFTTGPPGKPCTSPFKRNIDKLNYIHRWVTLIMWEPANLSLKRQLKVMERLLSNI